MTGRRTVAHVVGERLAAEGAEAIFGLMGSGNLVVTNALAAGGVAFYAARHENGAVGMADGWARATGRVGLASVHQGPGLTNTLTALAEAVKSRTPILVLAGETPAAALRSNFRIDQHGLVESVGAIAERVHSAATAGDDAARAYRRAQVQRRPVVLMLPIDLQAQDAPPGAPVAPAPAPPIPQAPAPAPEAVAAAAELLAGAQRPLILGGRGAVLADAGPLLETLAERTGALLATSAVAHGLFTGNPYNIGISGGFASPLAAELIAQADVILAVGATLNHWTTRHGALVGPGAQVVQVDLEATELGAHRPVALAIVGDAAATAQALLDALGPDGAPATGLRTDATAQAIAARRWRDEPYDDAARDDVVDPRTLSIALADLLPYDVAIAVDSGHFLGYPSMYLTPPDARSWLFANAFQAVGLGLGVAIGAAAARPDRVTVAVLGDGGTFLALEELETAARLNLHNLLVVIYDDAAYGAEVHHFASMGEDVAFAQFPDADLAAAGTALGARGATVRCAADLQAAVLPWLAEPTAPLVVDAKVDPTIAAAWLEEAFRAG